MKWKDGERQEFGRKQLLFSSRCNPGIRLERLRKPVRNLRHEARQLERDSNWAPPPYNGYPKLLGETVEKITCLLVSDYFQTSAGLHFYKRGDSI
jgi:hypothetical protein